MKPHVGKVPSAYLRSSMSMDFSGLQGTRGIKRFHPSCCFVFDSCIYLFSSSKYHFREMNYYLGRESLIPMEQSTQSKIQALHQVICSELQKASLDRGFLLQMQRLCNVR